MKCVVLSLAILVAVCLVEATSAAAAQPVRRNFQPQAAANCNNNAFGTQGTGLQFQYFSPSYGYGNYNYGNYNPYYGGYGNGYVNYGYPGPIFVSPAAFGYGPAAIFGW